MPDQNNSPTDVSANVGNEQTNQSQTLPTFPEDVSIPAIPSGTPPNTPPPTPDQTVSDATTPKGTIPSDFSPIIPAGKPKKKFGGGKIVATVLGLFILVGGVAAGATLVKQQQDIREKATDYDCPGSCETGISACTEIGQINISGNCNSGICCSGGKTPTTDARGTGGAVIGQACENNTSQTWNGGCVTIWCPNGDTNGDGGCGEGDQGYWYDTQGRCDEMSLGANECGQIDPIDENGTYCQVGRGHFGLKLTSCSDTPRPPQNPTAQCLNVKAYGTSWNELSPDQLSGLKTGDKVIFAVAGSATDGGFDKAKFTINGSAGPEVSSKKPGSEEFYYEYTVPAETASFNVKAQIHHEDLGWSN